MGNGSDIISKRDLLVTLLSQMELYRAIITSIGVIIGILAFLRWWWEKGIERKKLTLDLLEQYRKNLEPHDGPRRSFLEKLSGVAPDEALKLFKGKPFQYPASLAESVKLASVETTKDLGVSEAGSLELKYWYLDYLNRLECVLASMRLGLINRSIFIEQFKFLYSCDYLIPCSRKLSGVSGGYPSIKYFETDANTPKIFRRGALNYIWRRLIYPYCCEEHDPRHPVLKGDNKTAVTKSPPLWSRSFETSFNINPEGESALSEAVGIVLKFSQKMNKDPANWKYPVLVGVVGPGVHVIPVRELTGEEASKVAKYAKTFSDVKARFKLFTILSRNYDQWSDYIKSLLVAKSGLDEDETVELDRLQLNFHSAAKATLDHFKQHWTQKHRKTGRKEEFLDFIGKLEDTSWAFAFFQDLRNFTQHCGLPVGNYSRKVGLDSVNLKVECDSGWLVENYSGWEKSKLTKERGRLDLLSLSREYYVYLQRDFGNFVATEFASDILDAHNFFVNLAAEVTEVDPRARFNLVTSYSNVNNNINFQFSSPPADLLGSIGISMRPKTETEFGTETGRQEVLTPAPLNSEPMES